MQTKRILIPVDLSDRSFDALVFAQHMAVELPAQVTLLHVVKLNVLTPDGCLYDELATEARAVLRKLGKLFFGHDQMVNICVRTGRPHEEIIAEAEAGHSELIIMSGPRPSRWQRFFHHGIAAQVVRQAPCFTLVLPRNWRITPEQYRLATRPAPAPSRQPDFTYASA